MSDEELFALFAARDELALHETDAQYGKQCRRLAYRIVRNKEDAKEIWNDVLHAVWQSVPPQHPESFLAYLSQMTRFHACDRLDHNIAKRRGGGQTPAVLDELAAIIESPVSVEQTVDSRLLTDCIARFLDTQKPEARAIFMLRYAYVMQVSEIAKQRGISESKVKMTLLRTRERLRKILKEEGFL